MSSTHSNANPTTRFSAYKACMPFLLILVLMLATPTAWSDNGSPALEQQAATVSSTPLEGKPSLQAGPGSHKSSDSTEKKNDLSGFFAIGAIINILFFGAFIFWARRESQKSKKAKAGAQR